MTFRLHQNDLAIPGIKEVFDSANIAERLGLAPGDLTIANIRYKPTTSCLVSYQSLDDQVYFAKATTRRDWLIKKQKHKNACAHDDQGCFSLFHFPFDNELPALQKLHESAHALIDSCLFERQKNGRQNERAVIDLERLSYKPNRRYVAAVDRQNGKRLVLKLHDPWSYAEVMESWKLLKGLQLPAFPKIAGRSKRHHAFVFEWVSGTPLQFGVYDPAQLTELMPLIMEVVGQLHQSRKPTYLRKRKQHSIASRIKNVCDYVARLAPPLEDRISFVCQSLLEGLSETYEPRLIHGDLHFNQLLAENGEVRVCDVDNICVGDPMFDFANLVAHLDYEPEKESGMGHLARTEIVRVLESRNEPHSVERFYWNLASCKVLLLTHPFRSGDENWFRATEQKIRELEAQLSKCRIIPIHSPHTVPDNKDTLLQSIFSDSEFSFLESQLADFESASSAMSESLKLDAFANFNIRKLRGLRHRAGRRCLVEFTVDGGSGRTQWLGKATRKAKIARGFKIQKSLFCNHGFDTSSQIQVPEPLGTVPSWKMWFQRKIDGQTAGQLMKTGQLASVAHKVGEAISKLHNCHGVTDRVHGLDVEMEILTNRLTQVAKDQPDNAPSIYRILERCGQLAKEFETTTPVTIHRDYYQDQILFRGDDVFLLDLDLVSLGHPALDIGNFVAHLSEHGFRVHGDASYWHAEEQRVINGFLDSGGQGSRDDIQRAKCLSIARHISISTNKRSRRRLTSSLIAHVDQLIRSTLSSTHIRTTTSASLN